MNSSGGIDPSALSFMSGGKWNVILFGFGEETVAKLGFCYRLVNV
jgi:hypothetical protein